MGLPNLSIILKSKGGSAVKRGERGIVVLILKEKGPLNYYNRYSFRVRRKK